MSSKIQTAKEFYLSKTGWESLDTFEEFDHPKDIVNYMIEFAKLHVEAALKKAHNNQQLPLEDLEFTLSAYPLENIK